MILQNASQLKRFKFRLDTVCRPFVPAGILLNLFEEKAKSNRLDKRIAKRRRLTREKYERCSNEADNLKDLICNSRATIPITIHENCIKLIAGSSLPIDKTPMLTQATALN